MVRSLGMGMLSVPLSYFPICCMETPILSARNAWLTPVSYEAPSSFGPMKFRRVRVVFASSHGSQLTLWLCNGNKNILIVVSLGTGPIDNAPWLWFKHSRLGREYDGCDYTQ